jgi:nitroreductase
METLAAIFTRRSVSRYSAKPVPDELLANLIRAAMSAPSAGHEQAWQFIVINDQALLHEIPKFHPHAQLLFEAPLAVLVCGDLSREVHQGFWMQDCAAATENLLLASHDQGLGAVWIAVYPREDRINGMRQLLHLPDFIVPFALVAAGFAAEIKSNPQTYDPSRIHYNRWSNSPSQK